MIRNVVMGRLRRPGDADDEQALDRALAGIAALQLPGLIAVAVGRDAALRDGGWTFAITNDWVDADAYRNYDVDPEHLRHRQRIVDACEQVARVQFELPDATTPPPA